MYKKIIIFFTICLTTLSLNAKSLIALEGGYGSFDLDKNSISEKQNIQPKTIKIGAQTESMRFFLDMTDYSVSDFDTSNSFGLSLQFVERISNDLNYFLGFTGGKINFDFDSPQGIREMSNGYLGADVGFIVEVNRNFDIDIGFKYISIDSQNLQNGVIYEISTLQYFYGSLVYKFN